MRAALLGACLLLSAAARARAEDITLNDHWRGIVWSVGTYSYVTDKGRHVTIPAYTVSPDRAYQALAQSAPPAN